jgi:hypothetical protein
VIFEEMVQTMRSLEDNFIKAMVREFEQRWDEGYYENHGEDRLLLILDDLYDELYLLRLTFDGDLQTEAQDAIYDRAREMGIEILD